MTRSAYVRNHRRVAVILPAAGVLALLSACTSPTTSDSSSSSAAAETSPASADAPPLAPAGEETAIEIEVGDTVLQAHLHDSAATRALVDQLPLTLTFSDLNAEEKIGHLPQELPMDGLPEGDDPVPGDIGYYAPWGNLVFYYDDVGYWDGIARIGTFDSDVAVIEDQSEDFEATVRLAE